MLLWVMVFCKSKATKTDNNFCFIIFDQDSFVHLEFMETFMYFPPRNRRSTIVISLWMTLNPLFSDTTIMCYWSVQVFYFPLIQP